MLDMITLRHMDLTSEAPKKREKAVQKVAANLVKQEGLKLI